MTTLSIEKDGDKVKIEVRNDGTGKRPLTLHLTIDQVDAAMQAVSQMSRMDKFKLVWSS